MPKYIDGVYGVEVLKKIIATRDEFLDTGMHTILKDIEEEERELNVLSETLRETEVLELKVQDLRAKLMDAKKRRSAKQKAEKERLEEEKLQRSWSRRAWKRIKSFFNKD